MTIKYILAVALITPFLTASSMAQQYVGGPKSSVAPPPRRGKSAAPAISTRRESMSTRREAKPTNPTLIALARRLSFRAVIERTSAPGRLALQFVNWRLLNGARPASCGSW